MYPPTAEKKQESEQVAKTKRRAQVRRAQVQHRQRKANYVRQLEDSITGIQDQIAGAEEERQVLMGENEAIRARLDRAAAVPGFEFELELELEVAFAPVPSYVPMLDGGVPVRALDMDCLPSGPDPDEYLSAPVASFDALEMASCTNSGTGSSAYGSPQFLGGSETSSPYPFVPETDYGLAAEPVPGMSWKLS